MNFGEALALLKRGARVCRAGWNGKGMWIVLIQSWPEAFEIDAHGDLAAVAIGLQHAPFIAMKTADEKLVPWLASQTDMLAEDWQSALREED